MNPLTLHDIINHPETITTQATAKNGLEFAIRLVTPRDAAILGEYFLSVSDTLKSLYGPHPFDQATADRLCFESGSPQPTHLRLIGLLPEGRVIAYTIIQLSVPDHEIERYAAAGVSLAAQACCRVAPSVLDAYQNQGVGAPVMLQALEITRRLGFRQMVLQSGVFGHNEQARHFYCKMGFREAGSFVPSWSNGRLCFDMFIDL